MALKPVTSNAERMKIFGYFKYNKKPNGEIQILGNWIKNNIVLIDIPQLKGVKGAPKSCDIYMHKKAAEAMKAMFAEWEAAGLLKYVLTWGGSFYPRMIRGSEKTLSNHSFGTAFDINVEWNPLGSKPATGKGTVRPLIEIANKHGFFWGGDYNKRLDGMHFEYSLTT